MNTNWSSMYLAWGAFLLFLLADVAAGRAEIPAWATHDAVLMRRNLHPAELAFETLTVLATFLVLLHR